jgi:hypothetical protein
LTRLTRPYGLLIGLLLISLLLGCTLPPQFRRPEPPPTPTPAQSELTVDAKLGWQTSGVTLTVGDRVTVDYVSGRWSAGPGGDSVDAAGNPGRLARDTGDRCAAAPLPAEPNGALIARIGTGLGFVIGDHRVFVATSEAQLDFRTNVADACLGDDVGGVRVRVSHTPATTPTS